MSIYICTLHSTQYSVVVIIIVIASVFETKTFLYVSVKMICKLFR